MIVIFSSNEKGGIIQFSIELAKQVLSIGEEVKLFLPYNSIYSKDGINDTFVEKYIKKKSIFFHSKNNKQIVKRIVNLSPDAVLFSENTIMASQICLLISKKIKTIITFHDGGQNHSSTDKSFKRILHDKIENELSVFAAKRATNLLLLSKYSLNTFLKKYPYFQTKTILMNLGAHIPDTKPSMPKECKFENYLLFFGRIDKYKGLDQFVNLFCKSSLNICFVIAGNGKLQENVKDVIEKDKRITLINRYISDAEMLYLFEHARASVLPYVEATQSGIIPISYYYGKPVIVSDVEGLTQFVVDGETGYVCKNEKDYIESLKRLFFDDDNYARVKDSCFDYYKNNLDFKTNLVHLMKVINIDDKK